MPNPHLKEEKKTKLEAYMDFQADSIHKLGRLKGQNDHQLIDPASNPPDFPDDVPSRTSRTRQLDVQEKRVNEQLSKILEELNDTGKDQLPESEYRSPLQETSPEIVRLEQLMATLQSDTTEDKEMKRLESMLDKIIMINHPATPNRKATDTTASLPVQGHADFHPSISGFYGLKRPPVALTRYKTAIQAVVHEDQTIYNGSTIKLRLAETIYVGQQEIPAGSFIYGTCAISNERLLIDLDKIIHNNSLLSIQLMAYDTDGIAGIYVPGAITRDAAKEGLSRAVQSLSMTTIDPSVAAQATSAGIQSLKSLLSKKVKQMKVTVKAGHKVFLQ
ncbi:hypothetical protein CCY01nite_07540 [Chitinophaga cymbidii]|uniref:Conjugative transposon TraM C-terminal domain-containing protein n=1 Tax=Chitinophaga cymbidii TaxID=1096750 RepID=A0A512RFS6_9BACT|nr:hypothetical protein CCY01nite_07540 [Chitinophaga cymbidii]